MIINTITEALSLPFFQRALIITPIIAGLYGFLGTFTVIRKETIISHSIAHFAFLGVSIALLAKVSPTYFVVPFSLLAALLIWQLQRNPKFSPDSILTLSAHSALALALIVSSFQSGYRPEVMQFLFGNILALSNQDLILTLGISVISIGVFAKFFRPILQSIISKPLARSNNHNPELYNLIYLLIVAGSIAVGIKILGLLLIEAFLVFPSNIAKLHTNSFNGLLKYSALISIIITIIGLFIAYLLNLPASATIVLSLGVLVILSYLLKKNS